MADTAKANGHVAITVTDHGNMGNVPALFREARRVGIKAIAGIETYLCADMRQKGAGMGEDDEKRKSPYFHLTMLAQNQLGYANLCKLSTLAYTEGFHAKPRLDLGAIEQHTDGIIVLSGCVGGYPQQLILRGKEKEALEWCMRMKDVFGERFFLESQETGEADQKPVNATFLRWTKQYRFCHVLTGDSHYSRKEDSGDHDTLLCIGTRALKDAKDRMRFVPEQYALKSTAEMEKLGFPVSSITNTRLVADMCEQYDLPRAGGFPKQENADEMLANAATSGLLQRLEPPVWLEKDDFGHQPQSLSVVSQDRDEDAYWQRLNMELDAIKKLGFSSYFNVVHDIMAFAHAHDLVWTWGRGSAAGSLVAYALRITNIDPVEQHLYFERFLNPARSASPDIDLDFCDTDRAAIIQYIEEKYGAERVCHVATLGTLGPRQVLQDLCRTLAKPEAALKTVMAALPYDPQAKISDMLEDANLVRTIKSYLGDDVVDLMRKYEGIPRHASVHAAAVIIDSKPLADIIPFMLPRKVGAKPASQYMYDDMVSLGAEKLDVLGVRSLRTIRETARLARIDLARIPTDDKKTFDMMSRGDCIGVFQLESWGCRKFVKEFRPKTLLDCALVNALYRPGPMAGGQGLGELIARRFGKKPVTYAHPSLEPVLKDTYGLMLFQEQVMKVVQILAGWSLADADLMRRAISKKKDKAFEGMRDRFCADCVKMGHSKAFADKIFADIEFFSRYGWNRSHAAAYGQVTYVSAYLKANCPHEYLCCMLNSEESDPKHRQELIGECSRLGMRVVRPHVNMSNAEFEVSCDERGKMIRCGLASVGNLGDAGVAAILDARMLLGRFTSLDNFRERVPKKLCNKTAVEKLMKAKAFYGLPQTEAEITVPF